MRFFLLIVICLSTFLGKAQINTELYLQQGVNKMALLKDLTGAIDYFNIVIALKPHQRRAYYYRGISKMQLEDYAGAARDFDKVIQINPYYAKAYFLRGLIYQSKGELDKSLEYYNRAEELEFLDAELYVRRGQVYIEQKKFKKGEKDFSEAMNLSRENSQIQYYIALGYLKMDRPQESLSYLKSAIKLNNSFAEAYLLSGIIYSELLEDYATALYNIDLSIKYGHDKAFSYYQRANVRTKINDLKGALEDLNSSITLNEYFAEAYYNRSIVKRWLNRDDYEDDEHKAKRLRPELFSATRFDDSSTAPLHSPQHQSNADSGQQLFGNSVIKERRFSEQEGDIKNGYVQNRHVAIDIKGMFFMTIAPKEDGILKLKYYVRELDWMNEMSESNSMIVMTNIENEEHLKWYAKSELRSPRTNRKERREPNLLYEAALNYTAEEYNRAISKLEQITEDSLYVFLAQFSKTTYDALLQKRIEDLSYNFLLEPQKDDKKNQESHKNLLNKLLDAEKYYKNFPFLYYNKAYLYIKTDNYAMALKELDKAIELLPSFAEAYFNRGITYLYLRRKSEAAINLSIAGELGLIEAYNIIKRFCND